MPKPAEQSDCLVIGAGIAGLAFALQWAETYPESKVVVLNKGDWTSSNTWLAQGGIAAVSSPEDSFDQHRQDTLESGHYRSDSAMVDEVVRMGPEAIHQLEHWGVDFDREENGNFHLGKEGGHSRHRIVHHKDATGKAIIQQLQKRVEETPNIHVYHNFQVINLITTSPENHQHSGHQSNSCQGAYGKQLTTNAISAFQAPVTYLATGGSG